jgi:hypothetical protein
MGVQAPLFKVSAANADCNVLSALQSLVCLLGSGRRNFLENIFQLEGALFCQTLFMTLPSSAEARADTQPLSAPASLD